jgi:hypothetical protein
MEDDMRIKVWLASILLLLFPIAASAQSQKDALVQELYVKSGMEKQLAQIPAIIQADFDQAALKDSHLQDLPKNLVSAIRDLIPEAFTSENLKKTMLAELGDKLTVQDLKQVLKWLDSPLGKKCTRLEEAATTPEVLAELEQYAAQIKNSPPSARRLELITKLDAATKATENNVQIAINNQIAVALALNATYPLEQQQPPDFFAREMKKIAPQIEAALRKETLLSLLYTYRTLTDAETKKYIEFLRSPAGSKYTSVSTVAIKKAHFNGSIKWGKAVGEKIKQLQSQAGA